VLAGYQEQGMSKYSYYRARRFAFSVEGTRRTAVSTLGSSNQPPLTTLDKKPVPVKRLEGALS
jgi:hypothetical protein